MRGNWINRRHFTLTAVATWVGAAKATPGPRLLVLGDSLSAEYGLARGTGWVALLQKRLQDEGRPWSVVDASISGETASGGRTRLAAWRKTHPPGLVVIELGGNDALRGLALNMTRDNLQAMVDATQAAGARVLLLGMQMPPNYGADYSRQFSQMYAQLAQKNKLRLVPFLLQGLAEGADSGQWFQADRIHPNALAQPRMLDNVWPELKKLL